MSRKSRQPLTIEHALLGLVRQQPMHGYEIYQRLKEHEMLGMIWNVKQSQVYALLAKLEQAGYLATTIESAGAYPPRKVLHLTNEGTEAFTHWIRTPIQDWEGIQLEFLAKMLFAQLASDDTALKLVERQHRESTRWLETLEQHIQSLKPCQSSEWLVLQLRKRQIEGFLEWLDRCTMHFRSPLIVQHTLATINDSNEPELAQQFVAYVCSPAGQTLLEQHGFLPASEDRHSNLTPAHEALKRSSTDTTDRSLTILAAAVLKDVFPIIAERFSNTHGGITINLTFAGSQYLADKLRNGDTADVLAVANHAQMQAAIDTGRVAAGSEKIFARNRLVVVTPKKSQFHLSALRDLAKPGIKLALGSQSTAIGPSSLDVLAKAEQIGTLDADEHAAVLANVSFYEQDVRAVMERVRCGDADAGIVYTTDCQYGGNLDELTIVHPFLE